MRILAFAFALLLPGLVFAQPAQTPATFAAVPPLVSGILEETKAPGLAIAVAWHGRVVWEQGFGWADKEARVPATAHTLFGIASVTKSFTGTEIALLAERGRIDLDKPLNRYLGAARLSSPEWNADEATVRRVATHTAGLTSFDAICYADEPDCDRSQPDMIRRYGIVFWKPGARFDYSNLGYGALSQAIAEVRGVPYPEALRLDILAPLGIEECALDRTAAVAPHYAGGARAPDQVALAQGASSMACSADALLRFGMFHLGEAPSSGKPLLSPSALSAMHDIVAADDAPLRYGLGWWLNPDQHGYKVLFGSGGTADSGALLYLFPSEDLAIAILGNAGNPRLSDIADAIAGAVLPAYAADLRKAAPPNSPSSPPALNAPDPRLAAFAGTWRGSIMTWKGPVPVAFVVAADGTTEASIAGSPLKPERRARLYGSGGLVLGAHGDIGTPETGRRKPYRIGLELYPDGSGRLRGAATTWQDDGARNGGVFSHWVSLSRG